jgi:spore coat polysaccharide biosynthesis predicted glycosyltransferase SpsG
MNRKILFITDSGSKKFLGYGHIFRCLNIANFIKKKYEIIFFCERKESYKVLREEKFKLLKSIENCNFFFDYILCDLPNSNQINFKKFKYDKLIIIDEFNNFKKKIKAKIYRSEHLKKFLFLKFSHLLKKKTKNRILKKLNFIVSFGGTDYYNLTPIVYDALCKINSIKFKFLKKLTGKNFVPSNKIIKNYNSIFKSYKIDCFIGSGGNTMFEMLSHNIPCLIIPTSKMEKMYAQILSKFTKVRLIDLNKDFLDEYKKVKRKKPFIISRSKIVNKFKLLFS